MRPAARKGDQHACPHDAHQGGVIIGGSVDVIIEGAPAVRVGDRACCAGHRPNRINRGAPGVIVNGRHLARVGDALHHGGSVSDGATTVFVGEHVAQSSVDPEVAPLKLASRFALEQLGGLARKLDRADFIAWAGLIWGIDVGSATYESFREMLLANAFPNYTLLVVRGGTEKSDGVYDGENNHLTQIPEAVVRAALRSDEGMWRLMEMLCHEFGHHCDYVLRAELRRPGELNDDAPLEEGHALVYGMVHLGLFEGRGRCHLGTLIDRGAARELALDLTRLHALIGADPDRRFYDPKHADGLEHFAANGDPAKGHGDGHETIEKRALAGTFTPEQIERIYFGNWLRDFSQFVGGQWFHQREDKKGLDSFQLSSASLTAVVDVLARLKFGSLDASSKSACAQETDVLPPVPDTTATEPTARITSLSTMVTAQTLGVYRSWEHIDNPSNIDDRRAKDPRLQRGFTKDDGAVDPIYWTRRFIRTSQRNPSVLTDYPSAYEYAWRQLEIAAKVGPNGHGMRHLGQALHTAEDYFAHSNYLEVSLRRNHHPVITWAKPDPSIRHEVPIVTGTFGPIDIAASLSEVVLPKLMGVVDPFDTGRPLAEKLELGKRVIEILLERSGLYSIRAVKLLWSGAVRAIRAGKTLARRIDDSHVLEAMQLAEAMTQTTTLLRLAGMRVLAAIDVPAASREVLAVIQMGDDAPEPTHTQIGKDDPLHPLHPLAVKCAERVTRSLGQAMRTIWDTRDSSADRAHAILEHVFRHPAQAGNEGIGSELQTNIKVWGAGHPDAIRAASQKTFAEEIVAATEESILSLVASYHRPTIALPSLGELTREAKRALLRKLFKETREFLEGHLLPH